jgi:Glycosyltransferase like family 2
LRSGRLLGHLTRSQRFLAELTEQVAALGDALQRAQQLGEQRQHRTERRLDRIQAILQLIYDREPEFRERLAHVRTTPTYQEAFEAATPLVSVVIPTYDRGDLLVSRAIPSVLAQTYGKIEIVVVGDGAPRSTQAALDSLGDERVRYQNLEIRGPYPTEPRDLWHVAGIPARNTAVALARGAWIAPLDDDDAFMSDHVERLLELARRGRYEVAYGRLRVLMNDGSEFPLGAFPPEYGQFGWQGAIFHSSLRFFEMELADALFDSPADWSLCRRMLRAGVRFGMLPDLVTDHYESRLGAVDGAADD